MTEASESVAAQLVDGDRVERGARNTVEDVFAQMVRARTLEPRRYRDAAVLARAERDIAFDLAHDGTLGFTHTAAQADAYRRRYAAAFLAAWRDDALWQACRERYRPRGYIIVCMR